jgi:hypothetical protein
VIAAVTGVIAAGVGIIAVWPSRQAAGPGHPRRPWCPSILWRKKKMAFEQRMDIVLTYWHWLEYDSVALAVLLTGIGLVTLLVLSI